MGGGIVRNNKSGNISEKGLSKPFFMACDQTWPGITGVFPGGVIWQQLWYVF